MWIPSVASIPFRIPHYCNVFFYEKIKRTATHFCAKSFLNDKLSKWPILFYCVKRFLQIIEDIVDIFCTDGKTDGVWLDSLLCLFRLI